MTQLAYSLDPDIAREGSLAHLDPGRFIVTGIASEPIAPGRLVIANGANKGMALPLSAANITGAVLVGGISILDASVEPTLADLPLYDIGKAFGVLRRGRIYVRSEDVIAAPGAVYVRFQNGSGVNPIGRFSGTTHADKGLLAGARWLTTTSAVDQLALLEIAIP